MPYSFVSIICIYIKICVPMNKKLTDFLIFPFSCLNHFSITKTFVDVSFIHVAYNHCAQGVIVNRFRLNSEKIKAHTNMNNNVHAVASFGRVIAGWEFPPLSLVGCCRARYWLVLGLTGNIFRYPSTWLHIMYSLFSHCYPSKKWIIYAYDR